MDPAVVNAPEPVVVGHPRPWALVASIAVTVIGVACIVSPGLLGRRDGFPAESSVQTFGVCTTVVGAMATVAVLEGVRRRRKAHRPMRSRRRVPPSRRGR